MQEADERVKGTDAGAARVDWVGHTNALQLPRACMLGVQEGRAQQVRLVARQAR